MLNSGKYKVETCFFLNQDFSLNISFPLVKLYRYFKNIVIEGTVPQNFDLGLSFFFVKKTGKLLYIFANCFSRYSARYLGYIFHSLYHNTDLIGGYLFMYEHKDM